MDNTILAVAIIYGIIVVSLYSYALMHQNNPFWQGFVQWPQALWNLVRKAWR